MLAIIYLHYALDLWVEKIVKRKCRGEVLICRYADDFVCAFRYKSEAEWFYQELPGRLGEFGLQVAPEKTHTLRFSRFEPGMQRRFTFLGFEFYWKKDRQGVARVMCRTARKRLQRACGRIKEWILTNRDLPGKEFFRRLNARLRGHYDYYGVRGNYHSLDRFFSWAMKCTFNWLNRRGGKRRSYTWETFHKLLELVKIEEPRITEGSRRREFA